MVNVQTIKKIYNYQNFPEYDLASALLPDEIKHSLQKSHQVPGDNIK